jgi:hypothetical protein
MSAVAHNPAFAKKTGISQKVGKEYTAATTNYKKLPEKANERRGTKAQGD